MSITIRIPPWHNDDDVNHVSTSWMIYRDVDRTDLVHESPNNENMLYTYTVGLVLPVDTIWHCVSTMHFSDGTFEEVPSVLADYANIIDYNRMHKPYIIDTPVIHTDLLKLYNMGECTLTLTTSGFRTLDEDTRVPLPSSSHLYTHWFILNRTDEIIYSKMYDEDNRTSIDVAKAGITNFETGCAKILVIHGDDSGHESGIGYIDLTSNKE